MSSLKAAAPALAAALLFGTSTPLAKLLVGEVPPLLLAGLLYLGSGIGITHTTSMNTQTAGMAVNRTAWFTRTRARGAFVLTREKAASGAQLKRR